MVASCVWLCVLTFLFDVPWWGLGALYGVPRPQAPPGHVGDCRKALLKARMTVTLYQGLDIADWEKQDGEPLNIHREG
jgi:hypothetical protein